MWTKLKSTTKLLKPKSFSSPQAIAAIALVVAIGGFFIYRSFAAVPPPNGDFSWGYGSNWTANTGNGSINGPYLPTFANTALAPADNLNSQQGAVGLAIATPASTNYALGHVISASASASSTQNQPAAAADGNASTYWQTAVLPVSQYPGFTNSATIILDLGSSLNVRTVVLKFGANYAANYDISTGDSPDQSTYYKSLNQSVSTTGGTQTITLKYGAQATGRYMRIMLAMPVNSSAGIQLNDIGVFTAPTYQSSGSYSVVYNAGATVQWTQMLLSLALNGGTMSSNTCTADSAAAAVSGPWTSCTTDPNSVGTALVASQYIKITMNFQTSDTSYSPMLNNLNILWNTATPQPPSISIIGPSNNATVSGTVNITSNPVTNQGLSDIEIYNGSTLLGSASYAPYTYAWDTTKVPDGTYTLTAKIYDTNQNTATSVPVTVTVKNTVATSWWKPTSSAPITWDWQLQGVPSPSLNKQVYDIDGFTSTAADVAAYHATGAKVICYMDFGSSEDFRPDYASFTAHPTIMGSTNGWPGERWLDIRPAALVYVKPIMIARMQTCAQKGFDALEPDNIDGYANSSGFPLTAQNQLDYNSWIATTAHSMGLSVGLKNDLDQVPQLVGAFDWALNEQCNQYGECSALAPFVSANKAVFNAEYGSSNSFCAADIAAHYNGARFDLDLTGATYQPCGGWTAGAPLAKTSTTSKSTTTKKKGH